MYIERARSTFVEDKRNDLAFWHELANERDHLRQNLIDKKASEFLIEALTSCGDAPCGLAACPVCMARFDESLLAQIEASRQPPIGSFLLMRKLLWTRYRVSTKKIQEMIAEVKQGFAECDLEIYEYVGRLCVVAEGPTSESGPDCSFQFVGSMSTQPSYSVERGDLDFMFADMLHCRDVYDAEIYRYFDKNVMPSTMRYRHRNKFPLARAKIYMQCEVDIALTLGSLRCSDLLIARERDIMRDPRIN